MHQIQYAGHTVQCKNNETILECLIRSGLNIDFSCKSGVCHRCMLKCTTGEIPEHATKKLPYTHQNQNYLLACQCTPTTNMQLVAKTSDDNITQCMAMTLSQTSHQTWQLSCEAYRELSYQMGQSVMMTDLAMQNATLATLISDPEQGTTLDLEIQGQDISWLTQHDVIEGTEFYIRGPLATAPTHPVTKLAPNPNLWHQLGGDGKIRAVLTTFYQKVYADAQLAPFFERVTINRIIGKQFAFLKQNIVGDQVFLGEQPKNSHHWMVISNALFQHRMDLMRQALQEHDISDELIDALEQYELQFKTDIVKSEPWLKQVGDLLVDTEQYEECQLDEATVCDYCGAEIARYSMVRFHKRLGKLACQACTV
ncbi:2Fe-2S iron-sulfur cluster-binding protein [Acinetobacter sp. 5862]|jgi:truncated hemoglobin YjbI/ferredoxin|uniref:globin domain-containing protein n=1 Tax=Acinetobacter sp. 5862 TaxID=2967169 RepID=UPI002112D83F|nr:2Fe-2S iron-sulfur cluster-binding protein [Acinetobacter sp. 5862]